MEFCEKLYNSSNATMRALDSGVVNISMAHYVQMCINARRGYGSVNHIIIPYGLIFLLSVAGNALVILTLVRHKKMRTVTNMFLLNLAVSDLLLAVFCMPFTLIPMLMEQFIFGPVVCVLLRYAQAVSVGVSCATLVAISVERFYAICQPLKSRRWQTLKHSYRVIMTIWLTSATLMVPIAVFNKNIELNNGAYACREIWPSLMLESMYTILLDVVLLGLPLFLMVYSYVRISKDLWSEVCISTNMEPGSPISDPDLLGDSKLQHLHGDSKPQQNGCITPVIQSPLIPRRHVGRTTSNESSSGKLQLQVLRPANNSRVLANKKRVVKMLCVVVLEYFLCWTPLFVLNTWTALDYLNARENFTPLLKSAILLLSYLSSCIHPITYCFMNERFRQSFADVFRCCFRKKLTSTFNSVGFHINRESLSQNGRTIAGHVKISWKNQT